MVGMGRVKRADIVSWIFQEVSGKSVGDGRGRPSAMYRPRCFRQGGQAVNGKFQTVWTSCRADKVMDDTWNKTIHEWGMR